MLQKAAKIPKILLVIPIPTPTARTDLIYAQDKEPQMQFIRTIRAHVQSAPPAKKNNEKTEMVYFCAESIKRTFSLPPKSHINKK